MREGLLVEAVEADDDGIRGGLDLGEDHRAVDVHDQDELGVGRQLGLDVKHEVEVALVGGVGVLAKDAAVLVDAKLINGVEGLLADIVLVGRKRAVLQGDRAVDWVGVDLVAGGHGIEDLAALDALVGIGGAVDLDDGVLDVGELLGGETRDVGLDRLGGLGHMVGHHVEVVICKALAKAEAHGGRLAGAKAAGRSRGELLRNVDLAVKARLGDDVARVLEHDHALVGGLHAKGVGGIGLHVLLGNLALGERLLEEVDLDHGLEDAAGVLAQHGERLVLALLLDHDVIGVLGHVRVEGAAVLADGVHHELGEALGLGEVLDAPGDVLQDVPVGAEKAVPPGVAQDRDVVLGVGGAHVLAEKLRVVGVVGDAVAGHHRQGLLGLGVQVHAAVEERHQMGIEVVAREDVPLAHGGVVVAATLVRALAHVVLEHHAAGLRAPALVVGGLVVAPRGLHAAAEGRGEVTVDGGVLRDGAGQAATDGVGVDVHLRAELAAHAHRAPGTGLPHAGAAPEVLVHGGGEADARGDVEQHVRVGVVEVRDAVGALLAEGLDVVDPGDVGGVGLGVGLQARDARARSRLDVVHGRRVGGHVVGLRAAGPDQREDVLDREHLGKRGGAVVDALAPILVEVELAVAVEVLEGVAVDLDDLGRVGNAKRGAAVLVGHARPAVANLLAGPLGLGALLVGLDRVLVGGRRGQRVSGGGCRIVGAATGEADQACGQRRTGNESPA